MSAPIPRWGSLQPSLRPPSWIKGGSLLRKRWVVEGRGGRIAAENVRMEMVLLNVSSVTMVYHE